MSCDLDENTHSLAIARRWNPEKILSAGMKPPRYVDWYQLAKEPKHVSHLLNDTVCVPNLPAIGPKGPKPMTLNRLAVIQPMPKIGARPMLRAVNAVWYG